MKNKFRYLCRAMSKLASTNGLGLCFHHSAALVLDIPGSYLMIGDFHGGGERMIHAWVEHRGVVYAPSLIHTLGHIGPLDKSGYYEVNDARDVRCLPYREVVKLMTSIGYQAHLRAGRPLKGGPFAITILDAVGCEWEDDGSGGVIPRRAAVAQHEAA